MPSVTSRRSVRASSESIERIAPRYILRFTFCAKSRGLAAKVLAAADPDGRAARAGARLAGALLRVGLAATAAHFGARLLRLGARAAGVAVRGHHLVHQGLVELVAEGGLGHLAARPSH